MERYRHLGPLSRIALLVTVGDLLTKQAAAHFVAREPTVFSDWLRLAVVHNDQGAFGLSVGAYTWQLNLALTLAAIVFVIPVSRELTKVDRMAPRALGLIVGGALGNLISLLVSRHGVVDFIALRFGADTEIALNVADLAAYTGLALILRTGFRIVAAIRQSLREEAAVVPVLAAAATVPAQAPLLADREVPRPVFRDDVAADAPIGDSGPGLPGNVGPRTPFLRTSGARVLPFPVDRVRATADAAPTKIEEAR
jgi:lipoprotein signal peptidase